MLVSDLFDMIEDIYYIAGDRGAWRKIGYVDVVEIPEGVNWVKENDFIITTGYFLAAGEESLHHFVAKLIEKQASGLAVKLGKNLRHIPDSVVAVCEKESFPILSIPLHLMYRDAMQPINLRIRNEERGEPEDGDPINRFLWHIINRKLTAPEIEAQSQKLNFPYRKSRFLCALSSENLPEEPERLPQKLKSFCLEQKVLFLKGSNTHWYFLCRSDNSDRGFRHAGDFVQTLYRSLALLFRCPVRLGVSFPFPELSMLADAAEQTHIALDRSKRQKSAEGICYYRDILLPCLVMDNLRHPLFLHLESRFLTPLKAFDDNYAAELLPTLTALIENDFQIGKTAESLFLHRNTMYKRLGKISKLLDIDLKNRADRQILSLFYEYLKVK